MKNFQSTALLLILMVAGCTTSRITSSWKADNTVPKYYNKILVMGLVRDADRSMQENMETHIAGDLKELGYNAVSSFKEYGPKAFEGLDEAGAISKIKNNGVDGVLTIVLLDKEKERNYLAGNINYSPYGYYYNWFWGYHGTMYHRIYEPGYYVTDTKYFWESNFYDMSTQKLVYSVQTQSFDPATSERLGHEYGQMIVDDMVKNKIISKVNEIPSKAF